MADSQPITLKIRVLDAQGNFRGGTVDVEFKHRTLSDHSTQRGLDASREISIAGLRRAPTGDYQITVTPTDVFKPQSQFVNIPASGFASMTVNIDRAVTPVPKPDPVFVVKGIVRTAADAPLAKALVRAIHHNGSDPVLLGEGRTDTQGNYLIKYLPGPVKGTINLLVQVFDEQGGVLAASDPISPAQPMQEVDLVIKSQKPVDEKILIVRGTILDAQGKLVAGVTVRAFDRDMRSEEELGQTVTDQQGHYQINYSASQFRRDEKSSADLIVRVSNGAGKLPVSSAIIFNAQPLETVDLSFGDESRAPSEYETMIKGLTPLLQGVPLSELVENEEHKDISFLAAETGFDPQRITWLVRAAKLERETQGVSAEAFYGLFRQKLPTNLTDLLGQLTQPLRQALERSGLDNIIRLLTGPETDQIVNKLQALRADSILKPADDGKEPSLGDLLRTTLLTPDKQRIVAKLALEHDRVSEAFWKALNERDEFSKQELKKVGLTLQLAALTGSHLPLIIELQRVGSIDGSSEVLSFAELKQQLRPFARLDVADWKSLLDQPHIGTPRTIPGANSEEKINNYAIALTQYMENVLPTTVIASRLEKDTTDDSPFKSAQADLKTFFSNNPSFEFGVGPVDLYLAEGRAQKLFNVSDPGSLTAQLKGMARVFNIVPRYPEMRALLTDDLHSAQAIVNVGERRFIEKYALPLGGPTKGLEIYRTAKHVHATALNVCMKHAPAFNSPTPYVISGDAFAKPVTDNGAAFFLSASASSTRVDLSTLFGSLDLCDCEHCQSLFSPAAYLVDILKFLGDGPIKDEMTPLQALLARRPDIEHIELTCENTNTQLPYVDLANEILEAAIAPRTFHIAEDADIGSVLNELNSGKMPSSLKAVFAGNGYSLSGKASVRTDATVRVNIHFSWIILDDAWAFTLKRLGTNEGFDVFAWPQTSWTSEELRANPEHLHDEANRSLRKAVYPWNLPLDLPLEEMRAYLAHLGVQRHEVMEMFSSTSADPLTDSNIAYEYLGLSREEANIVIDRRGDSRGRDAWDFWGLRASDNNVADLTDGFAPNARGDWDVVLQRVSIFLQQSGLSYKELLELLGTYFINPTTDGGRTFAIVSVDPENAATCKLSKLEIQVVDDNRINKRDALIAAWDRIHRFVRLWRKLGWTMRNLDKAMTALTPVEAKREITEPFLVQLSHIQRLHAKLNIPEPNITSWFAEIDTASYIDHLAEREPEVRSLYKQLFRNKTVMNPIDEGFVENGKALTGKISDHLPALLAALGIAAADLSLLTTGTAAVVTDDNLTLANLSRLYRATSLARALRLTIQQYQSIRKLSGIEPFPSIPETNAGPAVPATRATLRFVMTVELIRTSGFSVEEVDYLLRHNFTESSGLELSEETIAATLDEIRGELQKIALENTVREESDDPNGMTVDPHGELTRKKLALLNWDTALIEQVVATLNGSVTYEAITDTFLPPPQLQGHLTYDEVVVNEQQKGRLRFVGPMTNERKAWLDRVSEVQVYRDAVQTLYNAPRNFIARYARAFSIQDYVTELSVLPAGVTFPVALRSKVHFDAATEPKQLHFTGVMTDQQRETLLGLSTDDWYQSAIKRLFNRAHPDSPDASVLVPDDIFLTSPKPLNSIDPTADTAILFDNAMAPAERFLLVLKRLLPHLRRTLSERTVAQKLAAALNLETKTATDLLTKWVDSPTHRQQKSMTEFLASNFAESSFNVKLTAAAFPDQFKTFTLLHKIALIVTRFKITPGQLDWLFNHRARGGWLDLKVLPVVAVAANVSSEKVFVSWRRLVDLFRLRDTLPLGELELFNLFDQATAVVPTGLNAPRKSPKKKYLEGLSRLALWPTEELEILLGAREEHPEKGLLNFAFPDDYQDERMLLQLRECFKLMKRIGASATQLAEWGQMDQTAAEEVSNARNIKNTVKAKYDDQQWPAVVKPLKDPLREKQRSALVSYLVAQRGARDASELYEYFLIDAEMSPCMMTTRIKQAISSVQLFIQRSLMKLETDVALTSKEAKEWSQWRKWYRVWEANRKVLLYPENWIEPELRDDKSPFFKELEDELLQDDVTMATAEDAFLHYLEKLDQVARLEIVGMYHQQDKAGQPGAVDILHVFGRTYAVPHIYFYRRLEDKVWSAWEKVDLDIEGDHLIPVVWNRRLYLFWAIFTEKSEQPTKAQRLSDEEPNKYWEIKLAWSEYKNKTWSPRKISKNPLRHNIYPYLTMDVPTLPPLIVPQTPLDFSFKTRISYPEKLHIECYGTTVVTLSELQPQTGPATIASHPFPLLPISSHTPVTTYIKFSVFVDNRIPTKQERDQITIQLREMDDPVLDQLTLNSAGNAYSKGFTKPVALWNFAPNSFILDKVLNAASWTPFPIPPSFAPLDQFAFVREVIADGAADAAAAGASASDIAIAVAAITAAIDLGIFTITTTTIATFGLGTAGATIAAIGGVGTAASIVAAGGGVIGAIGVAVQAALTRPFGRRVIVNLKTPPAPIQPDRVFRDVTIPRLMQGIGEFTLDDCNSALVVVPVEEVGGIMEPFQLIPRPNTKIQSMQFISISGSSLGVPLLAGQEQDSSYPSLSILNWTHGPFRLLATHQQNDYYSFGPFFFQDDQRSYFVSRRENEKLIRFAIYFHPWVGEFIKALNRDGIPGLLTLQNQRSDDLGSAFRNYAPSWSYVDENSTPKEDVDFDYHGAYSLYNWELFFHTPFLIAMQLSKNQRFEEAQKWFHYIFDPTATDSPGIERFWRVKPFYDEAVERIQTLEDLIADTTELKKQVDEWEANPFKPHVIARMRVVAYMKAVVMRYIDNLIAWGDQLFRRDTIESINEATQLYILAAQILGRRPESIPARAEAKLQTFGTLDDVAALDSLSNAMVEIESFLAPAAAPASVAGASPFPMRYFGVPANDKLLGYWDTVADRLFKIRHCVNIEGVERSLPMFEPPIDPALLVRAAAAGVDIASALNDINAPVPHYRFNVMAQKASELCNDVKALGAALLSALEKRDGEALALLRSSHEVELLKAIREIKAQQISEATNTLAGLMKYEDVVTARQQYYQTRPFMNPFEIGHLGLTSSSLISMGAHFGAEVTAAVGHLTPDAKLGFFTTVGTTYGGSNIAGAVQAFGSSMGIAASMLNTAASLSSTLGGYERRQDDWTHQAELATKELQQVKKQIAAAEIRLAISEHELQNHDLQIGHAQEVDAYMRSQKFTNQQLYNWMVGQLSGIYFQSYQLAFDMAKRAERAYRYELGLRDSSFIQFGYWDSLKKGLLSGERLHHDLKRMDVAYLDQNKREYEITKYVSLLTIDPISLVKLRETGECFVSLPEALFDIDYPGHYMRRIKSISLTIPCVTGPYAGVNCTLTQLNSSIRHANTLSGSQHQYFRGGADARFSDSFGVIQSIVTSHGQSDGGLFEANLRDERYLPFEGAGVISTWRIELPSVFPAFDYNTISDVVLHVRYTARDGGGNLKQRAAGELMAAINSIEQSARGNGLARLFSLRQEFPTEWHRLVSDANGTAVLPHFFPVTKNRFPFLFTQKEIKISAVDLYAVPKPDAEINEFPGLNITLPKATDASPMRDGPNIGKLFARSLTLAGELTVDADEENANWEFRIPQVTRATFQQEIKDILIVCHYSIGSSSL